jgi:hypothetical protein
MAATLNCLVICSDFIDRQELGKAGKNTLASLEGPKSKELMSSSKGQQQNARNQMVQGEKEGFGSKRWTLSP